MIAGKLRLAWGLARLAGICGYPAAQEDYAQHLYVFARVLPPHDCWNSWESFHAGCCGSPADLAHWAVPHAVTWHRCCAHLVADCNEDGSDNGGSGSEAEDTPEDDREQEDSCWTSGGQLAVPHFPVAREICCDAAGASDCWIEGQGVGFTFERCCGRAWRARSAGGCVMTPGGLWQIEALLQQRQEAPSYVEYWRDEEYAMLWRVVRQALNGRDLARPSAADVPCVFAFVATRMLSFMKLPWKTQWELLSGPVADGFELRTPQSQVYLALKLLYSMPLQQLVSVSPLSASLIKRIMQHSRKMRNFLGPDRLPYPVNSGFPLTDVGMSRRAKEFCGLLHDQLNRGAFVAPNVVHDFISSQATSDDAQRHPAYVFGLVVARIALAHSLLLATASSRDAAFVELEEAHTLLGEFKYLQARDSFQYSYRKGFNRSTPHTVLAMEWSPHVHFIHILFTEWPFWKLLYSVASLLAEVPDAALVRPRNAAHVAASPLPKDVLIVHCAATSVENIDAEEIRAVVARGENCREALERELRSSAASHAEWIVIASPFLKLWDAPAPAIRVVTEFLNTQGLDVAGFPVVDGSGQWRWPVSRVRLSHWHLRYEPYPTGHALALGFCAGGDATSATRVYRGSVLRDLLGKVRSDSDDTTGALLFVELDLLAKRHGVPSYTCMNKPLAEASTYLEKAVLTKSFGRAYDVEVAEFMPRSEFVGNRAPRVSFHNQDLCGISFKLDRDDNYRLVQAGMASRPCFRLYMQQLAFRAITWWRGLDPDQHVVMPVQGTLLTTLVRGGEIAVMPWDIDLEFVFASTAENPILAACLFSTSGWEPLLRCIEQELARGLGTDVVVTASPTASFIPRELYAKAGVTAKIRLEVLDGLLDITLDSRVDANDLIAARFLGTEVHFVWDQWEYQLFEIYGGDLSKKVGTSGTVDKSERCGRRGHTACLVENCEAAAGCTLELDDWFAHARVGR